jgi:hypothetical protein
MTDAQQIAEIAADGVADGMHVVSEEAQAIEQMVRNLNAAKIQFTALGYVIGAATGALIAFKVAYKRAETKFSQIADDEIDDMREHYQARLRALEGESQKGDLSEIVKEKGYVSPEAENNSQPLMAVSPPDAVVEKAADAVSEETTRIPPPVPADPAPEAEVRNVFRDAPEEADIRPTWDHTAELAKRNPDIPYVIHYDERHDFEDYSDLSLTYYEADDVLCNERNEIIPPNEREALVGEKNLDRFGHGAHDQDTVIIRNDRLELLIEVVRSRGSFVEEVHGLEHTGYGRNLQRMHKREHEELDDDG